MDESLYNGTMWHSPLLRERFYEVVIVDMEVSGVSLAMDCKEVSFHNFDDNYPSCTFLPTHLVRDGCAWISRLSENLVSLV